MFTKKMDNIFSSKTRNLSIVVTSLFIFISLILLRSQTGSLKIALLCVACVCLMFFIVLYKNSINKYEIGIFCFLCVQLLVIVPDPSNIDSLVSTSYLLSYRYGVSSRSLIATLVDFLSNGQFISKYFVWSFIFCATIILSFIISVYLGAIIQKAEGDIKVFLIFLSFLYLSCFTAPATYFGQGNFGRLEIFAFLFILLFVFIINKVAIKWLIPLLALFIIATHLILVFFYIPLIIIMLLYEIFTKKDKSNIFLLILTIALILAAFLCYVLFYEKTFVFKNAHSFFEYLVTKTDVHFTEDFLHMTLFAKLQEHLDGWKDKMGLKFNGNLSILINLPFLFLAVVFWSKCFIREGNKIMKFFFLLPSLVLMYHSLAFFMFFDFGRWMIMILNCQFIMIFYLVFVKNETVLSVVQAITPFLKKNKFFIVLLFLICTFLGPVEQVGPSERMVLFVRELLKFMENFL